MTARIVATSLALALLASPLALAEARSGAEAPAQVMVARAETAPAEVAAFLKQSQSTDGLSSEALQSRIDAAQTYLENKKALPRETRQALKRVIKDARAAMKQQKKGKKGKAGQSDEPSTTDADMLQQPADDESQAAPTTTAEKAKRRQSQGQGQLAQPEGQEAGTAEASAAVKALLSDQRPAGKLSDDELEARMASARSLLGDAGTPRAERAQIRQVFVAARKEAIERRQGRKQPEQPADTRAEPPGGGKPARAGSQAEQDFLAGLDRPAADLSEADLRQRIGTGRDLLKDQKLAPNQRQRVMAALKADRDELIKRRETGGQRAAQPGQAQQPQKDKDQEQALDGNRAAPEAEAKAQALLAVPTRAADMQDAALRIRLDDMRALLRGNQLAAPTERALRQRLAQERQVLRTRVVKVERDRSDDKRKPDDKTRIAYNTNITLVLDDRRPSLQLAPWELRRRIDVYSEYAFDEAYDENERLAWRQILQRDREVLRRRLIEERRHRAAELAAKRDQLKIGVNVDLGAQEPEEDIVAAEADDQQIQDVLVAAPRRKVDRRYTIEEIESEPAVREAMPAIEIDTINFGFNEAFVREEEVDKLDRIGSIMERILAAHPNEIFLIEGHTDAIGSDDYNLDLSRQRAEAVVKALSSYYVISAENLKAAGYGERFLKIPTAEAEEENRRVAIRRVTPLIGELSQ